MDIPYRPGLAVRQGELRARSGPVRAIVIHTAGAGPAIRVDPSLDTAGRFVEWRRRHPDIETTHAALVWAETTATPDSGHYAVGQAGECTQIVPDELVARHVGSAGSQAYASASWLVERYAWWRQRWPHLRSPRDLAAGHLWDQGSCNGTSIGIEVAPPLPDPQGPWSEECWRAIVSLVRALSERHGVPLTREHVVTHSDAHPIARTARSLPWDPGPKQWTWERLAGRL